jgi:hypothetical protein
MESLIEDCVWETNCPFRKQGGSNFWPVKLVENMKETLRDGEWLLFVASALGQNWKRGSEKESKAALISG